MAISLLNKILNRLVAMKQDTTSAHQERLFEVDGKTRAKVCYNQEDQVFSVMDYTRDEVSVLEFDDIDYAAIEIFELVQPITEK